jgi:hypothetical protein
MIANDLAYFSRRAATEDRMATLAVSRRARAAHAHLARLYRTKVDALQVHASYTVVDGPTLP